MTSTSFLKEVDMSLQPDPSSNYMKAEVYNTYVLPTFQCLQIFVLFTGMFSNPVNIFVFFKIGRQDAVSLSFLLLAVCDFFYILIISLKTALSFIEDIYISEKSYVSTFTIENGLAWYAIPFYDIAVAVNSYIGVTRACCVVLPLKFKTMFTLYTTKISLSIIFIVVFLLHCPMMVTQRLIWSFNRNTNTSLLVLQQNRGFPLTFHNIVNNSVLYNVCLIIAIISLILLAIKLREAMKFRQTYSSGGADNVKGSAKKERANLIGKDIQVIKTVTLVTLIYVVCNLPFVINSILRLAILSFDRGEDTHLYNTVLQFRVTFSFINSSINIFIYYNYNRNYREFVRNKLGMSE